MPKIKRIRKLVITADEQETREDDIVKQMTHEEDEGEQQGEKKTGRGVRLGNLIATCVLT